MQENATSPTMLMHMSNYIRHIYIYINIQNLYWIMCNELLNRIMIMSTFTKT